MREHWHKCSIACQPSGDLVAYSRDKENTVNILNYKTCQILHLVTVNDLNSVDVLTVSPNGLAYVAEYDGGPIVSFELTTGQKIRQIAGGQSVAMTAKLETTPDAKYILKVKYFKVKSTTGKCPAVPAAPLSGNV